LPAGAQLRLSFFFTTAWGHAPFPKPGSETCFILFTDPIDLDVSHYVFLLGRGVSFFLLGDLLGQFLPPFGQPYFWLPNLNLSVTTFRISAGIFLATVPGRGQATLYRLVTPRLNTLWARWSCIPDDAPNVRTPQ